MARALADLGAAVDELARRRGRQVPPELSVATSVAPTDAAGWQARATSWLAAVGPALVDAAPLAPWRDGAVYCYRCRANTCAHATPPDPRAVFAGYEATGKPTWAGFLEVCLAARPEGLDALFESPPGVVALAQAGAELGEGLLPGFGADEAVYVVHGQVVLGLVPRDLRGSDERVALTLQAVEVRHPAAPARLRLNLLGPLDHETITAAAGEGAPRNRAEQLRRTLEQARRRLETVGRRVADAEARGEAVDAAALIEPLTGRLRGDLIRVLRPRSERTRHAEQRHRGGERPTSAAFDDARAAGAERLLADRRRQTVVVLGPRNRAHVFTREGRHVTSLRLEPGEVGRKTASRRWVPLDDEAVRAFRAAVEGAR
ncbi:MAG: hypothetical protein H6704_15245 [Myxococcales bacterium]|nr:hypothetical protein [Myxococcales bacterium]